jgi:hypothetical protein
MCYKFCSVHQGFQVASATEAEIALKVWEFEDVVALIDTSKDEREPA